MDIWSIKETFIDRFYERYGCPVGDGWTVVDIGAGIGEYTIFALSEQPTTRVYAFEPFADSFVMMQRNIALNPILRAVTIQKAVWSQAGQLALDLSRGEPLQLTSEEANHNPGNQPVHWIESISLTEIIQQYQLDQIDMLKLDCEGAEYPILYSLSPDTLRKIQRIVMEYHDSTPPHHHTHLVDHLRACGYSIQVTPNRVHSHLGYLYAARE